MENQPPRRFSSFDDAYRGTPPWDIGHPQKALVELGESGEVKGRVLDIGCGTGEHALYFAKLGHEAWGIDFAPKAIDRAREKAKERGLNTHFEVVNALDLAGFSQTFDTVID